MNIFYSTGTKVNVAGDGKSCDKIFFTVFLSLLSTTSLFCVITVPSDCDLWCFGDGGAFESELTII